MLCPNPKQKEYTIWDFRCLSRKIKTKKMENKNKKKSHVSYNSGNNEWYTPQNIIDAAKKTMGSVDLDPASSETANRTVQATTIYTKEDDGLIQPWFGNIWLNPPYARNLIGKFASAIKDKRMEYDQAIILVNNSTETVWFHNIIGITSAICLVKKRIRFHDKNGKLGKPLQGQVILYIGSHTLKFIENFSQFGACRVKFDNKSNMYRPLGSHFYKMREKRYFLVPDKIDKIIWDIKTA